jgi:hypothetical protein
LEEKGELELFFLIWERGSNKIQSQQVLAVAFPSKPILPLNIALVEQGRNKMPVSLGGGHFCSKTLQPTARLLNLD